MRYTIECVPGRYRLPLAGQEVYAVEVEKALELQENKTVMNAYFGPAVDKLGQYEDIGSIEEVKAKLAKLAELERKIYEESIARCSQ